jgi:hypothetical protein
VVSVIFLARWNDGVLTYAPGRVVDTTAWPAGQYQNLRNGGVVGDTTAAADGQTPATPYRGTMVGAMTDSSGRKLVTGSAAGISVADATLARNDGKLDSATLPVPVLSAVSATALGGGSVRFAWTSDQVATAKIEWGPTTAYAGGSVTTPSGQGAQTYTYGVIATGITHYRITLTSAWGTTVGADNTVTVT